MITRLTMTRYVIFCLLAACFMPGMAFGTTFTINVNDNSFSNGSITIEVGDTVRWVNAAGGNPHDVTSNSGAWVPSPTSSSFTFEVIFNTAGTFGYFCSVHYLYLPAFMTGTITVESAAAAELELQSVDATNGSYSPVTR